MILGGSVVLFRNSFRCWAIEEVRGHSWFPRNSEWCQLPHGRLGESSALHHEASYPPLNKLRSSLRGLVGCVNSYDVPICDAAKL
jgi:hypothetical protein